MVVRAVAALVLLASIGAAQVCRLSVAGLNRSRRVFGAISAECPDPVHSAPFGNWGATSNFGPKHNGHQFQGWCHDQRICDNSGFCRNNCSDGWYEWNSCTVNPLYQAPNCSLYNASDCTEQESLTGINVLGTQTVDVPVSCPTPSADGTRFERGGCLDVQSYGRTNNFMSLYELDPVTGDELVQTLYFPSLTVAPFCNAWSCAAAGSDWVSPSAYDSPVIPAKVFAEMAMVVNFGDFVNPNNVCHIDPLRANVASSASFRAGAVAIDSLATVSAQGLTLRTESATSVPLPRALAGLEVHVVDGAGVSRTAPMIYASPGQINFLVPAGSSVGTGTVSILGEGSVRATSPLVLARIEPGIFTANGTGQGVAAAVGIRVQPDGRQLTELSFHCDSAASCVPEPLDLGSSSEQFILVLFGTGWRNATPGSVAASIGGVPVNVQFAGSQPSFAGLDQANLLVPKSLAGRGLLDVRLTFEGKETNPAQVWFQ